MDEETEQKLRLFYETLLSFQTKSLEQSSTYNQVIILAGYAAFFAVWSTVSSEIPRWALLVSGGLIVISVIVYVAWTVANMILLKTYQESTAAALAQGFDDFFPRLQQVDGKFLTKRQRIMRWWLPVVAVAGFSALFAAGILASTSLVAVIEQTSQSPRSSSPTLAAASGKSKSQPAQESAAEPSGAPPSPSPSPR